MAGAAGDGMVLVAGGVVANGGTAAGAAMIEGLVGVYAGAGGAATVTNFGTIDGTGGTSVQFANAADRLVVEAGSAFVGQVKGGGGALELAGGAGTIAGLGGAGTLSGAASASFSGFGTYKIDGGASWTIAGSGALAAGQSLSVANGGTLSLSGAIANAGTLALAGTKKGKTQLVLSGNATLAGGGRLDLGNSVKDSVIGTSGATTLTNQDNTIVGGGSLGGGRLTLINGAAGVIDATAATALTLDTGAKKVVNAGLIESTGKGGLVIAGAVVNTGTLAAMGGNLTVMGAVTGAGGARIDGGVLDFASGFNQAVSFTGKSGVLELANSQTYTAAVSGFSKTGGTALDLVDIAFVSASEATFSGTKTGGVLTVTDGIHTATINLVGNYTNATFVCADDLHGGVTIVDPPAAAAARPPPHAFIAAMAGMAAPARVDLHSGSGAHRTVPAMLAAGRRHFAP
ncbi:MAG: hypothetical protein ACR2FH_07715 [Caulobacteraceae bacterium]